MNVIAPLAAGGLAAELARHVGRHAEKSFDWDAFPSNRGFPRLARAQMRYIGAGGSPKVGDPATMKPGHFTLSLVHKPAGNFAACHAHEVAEAFLILQGVLTVGWAQEGSVVEVRLGPGDMILNAPDVPHGFRNDGVEPVLMSIMVGAGKPLPPRYVCHPKDNDLELAARFGAAPERTEPLSPAGTHPLQGLMAQHVVRFAQQPTRWDPAGVGRKVYVGEGGAPVGAARKERLCIPRGVAVRPYARATEEAFLILEGCLTMVWEQDGEIAETRLGPRDVVMTPPGRRHWFRNDDMADVQAFMVVGGQAPETVTFEAP